MADPSDIPEPILTELGRILVAASRNELSMRVLVAGICPDALRSQFDGRGRLLRKALDGPLEPWVDDHADAIRAWTITAGEAMRARNHHAHAFYIHQFNGQTWEPRRVNVNSGTAHAHDLSELIQVRKGLDDAARTGLTLIGSVMVRGTHPPRAFTSKASADDESRWQAVVAQARSEGWRGESLESRMDGGVRSA